MLPAQHTFYKLTMPRRTELNHTFQMRVDPAFIKTVDDWRRLQPDLPSRAEAIRRLVNLAIGDPGTASMEPSR
jgi:hypothetical protein